MSAISFHKQIGLTTNVSPVLQPGGLVQAWNAVIRRDGWIEQRRSYRQFMKSAGMPVQVISGMFQKSAAALYAQTTSGAFYFWSTTSSLTGVDTQSYNLPISNVTGAAGTGDKTYARSASMNGNLYFATSTCVYSAEGVTFPRMAGLPAAPDIISITGAAGNILANNTGVAYRVVWGVPDSAGNVIQGPPSGRALFFNTSGQVQNPTLTYQIPAPIVADMPTRRYNFYIFRTVVTPVAASLGAIADPGDSMNLIYQGTVSGTPPANNVLTFTDTTPDGYTKGPDLYTNSGQGGIRVANYMPPCPTDICAYRGVMYYAGRSWLWTDAITSLGIPDQWTFTVAVVSNTVTLTFNVSTPDLTQEGIVTGTQKVSVTGNAGTGINGDFVITAVGTNTISYTSVGAVAGAGGFAMTAMLDLGATTVKCHASFSVESGFQGTTTVSYIVSSSGSTAQNIVLTVQSLVRALNKATLFNVKWVARAGDTAADAPGLIRFESICTGATAGAGARGSTYPAASAGFTFLGVGKAYGKTKWYPAIDVQTTSNFKTYPGRLFYSKTYQPEAVPLLSYYDVGDSSLPIRRIVSNRDSLFIFKDDGVFRLYGDPNSGAVPTRFDDNIQLLGDNMVAVLHNDVYALTNRGVCAINDSGVRWISKPIQDKIRLLADWAASITSGGWPIFGQHAIANERDGCVYFYMQFISALTDKSTRVFSMCYSADTETWTQTDAFAGPLRFPGFYSRLGFGDTTGTVPANSIIRHSWDKTSPISSQEPLCENAVATTDDPALNTTVFGVPLPGDGYFMTVTAASGGTVTLASSNTWSQAAAVGDVLYQTITGVSYAWQVTALGPVTITPLGGAPANMSSSGSFDGTTGLCLLLKAFTTVIEWTPFVSQEGSSLTYVHPNLASLKHWNSATIMIDQKATADAFSIALSTELVTTPVTQTLVSRQQAARIFVPLTMARSRKLSVSVTHAQAAKFMVIDGIQYEYSTHQLTRENE